MTVKEIETKMLAGYTPAGYAAVTRRQVSYFLMKLFNVNKSTVSHWRHNGYIPEKSAAELKKLLQELADEQVGRPCGSARN